MDLQTQLEAARRELALRRSTFPKWVRAQRMAPAKAAHEIEAMAAIVRTLERCLDLDSAGLAWAIEAGRTTPFET